MLNLVANGPSGYNLTNSLRFRSSASAYLSRTPASATNQQTWTYSTWIKLGSLSLTTQQFLLNSGTGDANRTQLTIDGGLTIGFTQVAGGSVTLNLVTSAVYRDPSAWYHIVIVADTTNATASNRARIYVNGIQVTAFGSSTYWAQNTNSFINTTNAHFIGKYLNGSSNPSDWYQAETNFIDGQALTPSSFGSTNSTTGVWQPAKYSGSYGTNGFYLKFSNIALTSGSNTGLGQDYSGNGNYWNTNNISVTAGTTYDAMTDVPTLTSATVANYCTLNPLKTGSSMVPTAGNLSGVTTATVAQSVSSTIGMSSGKWYWEATCVAGSIAYIGIVDATHDMGTYIGSSSTGSGWAYNSSAQKVGPTGGTTASYGATYTANDIIGVALDVDAGTLAFYLNGVSQGTAFTGLTSQLYFAAGSGNGVAGKGFNFNFGQRPFTYTPPTGYVALNTYNLPTSTIVQGNKYMDATLYTGNGTSQSINNAGSFQPDAVWIKARNIVENHVLYNSNVGTSSYLLPNSTVGDQTPVSPNSLTFSSTGFNLPEGGSRVNGNTNTYVAWQWQAGKGTNTTNTSGSITSTVSVNASAGFSIVTYTGTGANATVGHGLGVAPKMVIIKNRSSGSLNWGVYNATVGNTKVLLFNTTAAASAADPSFWNNTSPTSTTFSLGTWPEVNNSGNSFVAYCWADISGYSKAFSYTGNGSSDGPMVYLGFRPKFIMIKRTDSTSNWVMFDTSRSTYNLQQADLYANLSDAEATNAIIPDILSNGFKVRTSNATWNTNGGTWIGMAFAESPFKVALAR